MLDHVSLGVHDLDKATEFYTRVLAAIGYRLHRKEAGEVAFGPEDAWSFFLYPAERTHSVVGARAHIAFRAADRDSVRAFYRTALAVGGSSVPDREPAERPQFGEDYFGAVLNDPDGHVIEVLTRAA
jgi:catechol 2,3-dioxygenase-like lactoylglutathione lyase family enzyme